MSGVTVEKPAVTADERIAAFAARINRLMDERDGIGGDIKDVFTEVKSAGFNAAALRKVIAAMRMDREKRETLEFDIDAYRLAVGLDRARAEEMLAEGAGIRETHRATGVPLATLHRRSKSRPKTKIGTPPHDPETGEIAEPPSPAGASPKSATDCDPVAAGSPPASPAGEDDEPTVSVSVHHNGETLADSGPLPMAALKVVADAGPLPDFLDRRKELVA